MVKIGYAYDSVYTLSFSRNYRTLNLSLHELLTGMQTNLFERVASSDLKIAMSQSGNGYYSNCIYCKVAYGKEANRI